MNCIQSLPSGTWLTKGNLVAKSVTFVDLYFFYAVDEIIIFNIYEINIW